MVDSTYGHAFHSLIETTVSIFKELNLDQRVKLPIEMTNASGVDAAELKVGDKLTIEVDPFAFAANVASALWVFIQKIPCTFEDVRRMRGDVGTAELSGGAAMALELEELYWKWIKLGRRPCDPHTPRTH